MKKILSVFLAMLMLFGALSIGASAVTAEDYADSALVNENQVVLVFKFNGGKSYGPQRVYNPTTNNFDSAQVEGDYIMIPYNESDLIVGTNITLPDVTPASGDKFIGWYCEEDGKTYAVAANGYEIPAYAGKEVITFTAWYKPAEPESDTLGTILGILTKVFGAIIGIVLYGGDTEAGVALMNKVLGGLDL